MKVKVKDIAALAGVSATTVSLVLNNKPCRVAEETRERILRIEKELSYQQDNFGFFQEFKKVRCVGLIVPEIENPYFTWMAIEISKCFMRENYTVFQCNIDQSFESFRNAVECLIGKNVDGVIVIPPEQIDKEGITLVKFLQKSQIPMILLDRAVYSVFCDFVSTDNKYGGRIATEYLIGKGHKRIGILLGGESSYTSRKRLEGYKEALARHRIPFDDKLVFHGKYDMDSGIQGAEILFEQGIRAYFALNDRIAQGVYLFAEKHHLRAGKDISVIGYDNTAVCGNMEPGLTSIEQNVHEMAEKVMEILLQKICSQEAQPIGNYYFTPMLIERDSVCDLLKSYSENGTS